MYYPVIRMKMYLKFEQEDTVFKNSKIQFSSGY